MVQPKHKSVAVPLEIRQEVARNVLKRPMLVEELLKRVRKVHPDATVEQVDRVVLDMLAAGKVKLPLAVVSSKAPPKAYQGGTMLLKEFLDLKKIGSSSKVKSKPGTRKTHKASKKHGSASKAKAPAQQLEESVEEMEVEPESSSS